MVNLKDLKDLTDKQREEIEPKIKSAKSYKRKISNFNRKLKDNPGMDVDKKREIKDKITSFESAYATLSNEIDMIMNAKSIYKQLVDIEKRCHRCVVYMENKWGFEDETN